jgi:hypothetical protein
MDTKGEVIRRRRPNLQVYEYLSPDPVFSALFAPWRWSHFSAVFRFGSEETFGLTDFQEDSAHDAAA